jgi:hypothetical protein
LQYAGLQTQDVDTLGARMGLQAIQETTREAPTPERRAHIHALDLSVRYVIATVVHELDPRAPGGDAIGAQHEEGDRLREQSLDAQPVPALCRIQRRESRLQFGDQLSRVNRIGAFAGDRDGLGMHALCLVALIV